MFQQSFPAVVGQYAVSLDIYHFDEIGAEPWRDQVIRDIQDAQNLLKKIKDAAGQVQ